MTDTHAGIIQRRDEGAASGPRRERWLFVDGAESFGGHEVMLLRWLEELAAQRSVDTFLLARSEQLAREGSRYASLLELSRERVSSARDAAAFGRHVLNLKPDLVIVAEGCPLAQWHFVLAARMLNVKVVVYVPLVQTTTSMGFGRGWIRDAIVRHGYANLPHGWITLTSEQISDFQSWSGVRRPMFILPNTVSRAIEDLFELPASRTRDDQERLRIVVLGRIEAHQKGLDQLLDYGEKQPALGERLELTLVGNGPFEAQVNQRLRRDPKLARWVRIKPWSATADVLKLHDVLLLASRYEGVPLVMLEAMAAGMPVVAPDLSGTHEFLSADCLYPRNDMYAAFRCVERLIDLGKRTDVALRNRAAFESLASNAAFAAAVKSLTQSLRALSRSSLPRSA